MKLTKQHRMRSVGALILFGMLAVLVTTVACSSDSAKAARPAGAAVAQAKLEPVSASVARAAPVAVAQTAPAVKPAAGTLLTYRSRNYGVSFTYPWQYAFVSAKAVATGDPSRRPQSDGYEGQFTLARVEIPKGFYPDTDFASGYFMLSLNQDLGEPECLAALGENAAPQSETINGAPFRWVEVDAGGRGSAQKLRNYAVFVNGTCYEIELGVKTSNEDGLAREIDPDQVFRRLDAILRTLKFAPEPQTAPAEVKTSAVTSPAPPQH